MTDILRTKAVLNFAFFLIPKREKIAPSLCQSLKVTILIRSYSLISDESKAKKNKTVCEYLMSRASFKYLKYWS